MLNSTSDVFHEDQVSESLRYVDIDENRKVEIKDIYAIFFPKSTKICSRLSK